jgi:hypothetical protein
MLFYRSPAAQGSNGLSHGSIRALAATALAAYPAGTAMLARFSGGPGMNSWEAVGYAFIAVALIAALPVLGSPLHRITAENIGQLDEMELQMRYRATGIAFWIFCAGVQIAVLYFAIASEAGWWRPTTYEGFNAIFWGVVLYSALLPTAVLAWTTRSGPQEG